MTTALQSFAPDDERRPAGIEASGLGTSFSTLVSRIGVLTAQDRDIQAALRGLCRALQDLLECYGPTVQPEQTEPTQITAIEVSPASRLVFRLFESVLCEAF